MNRRHPSIVLAAKELSVFFNAPATFVIYVLFLVMTGWLFVAALFQANQSSLDSFLRPLPLLFTFLVPALTMRTFSEEYKSGTIEYLSTLPLKDYEIIWGKYLAALGLVGMLAVFTLFYPLVLMAVGRPDLGQLLGAYAAIAGLAAFDVAIGLWASAITRNQVVAFIIGFFACFFFFLLGRIAQFCPTLLAEFLRAWSIDAHFDALARGVLDSRDILYWISGSVFFLSACLAALHSRRWR